MLGLGLELDTTGDARDAHVDVSVHVTSDTLVAVTRSVGANDPVEVTAYGFEVGTGERVFRQPLNTTAAVAVVRGDPGGDPMVLTPGPGRRPGKQPQDGGPELVTLDLAAGGAPQRQPLTDDDLVDPYDFQFYLAGPSSSAPVDASTPDPDDAELVAYRAG